MLKSILYFAPVVVLLYCQQNVCRRCPSWLLSAPAIVLVSQEAPRAREERCLNEVREAANRATCSSSARGQARGERAPRVIRERRGTGEQPCNSREVLKKPITRQQPPYANAGFFCAHSNTQAYADLVKPPAYSSCELGEYFRPEVLETIEDTLEKLNPALRELSLDILHHPEIQWEEKCV